MRIAFATCHRLESGHPDDLPAAVLLDAEFQVWNDPAVDWSRYDRVVVRSVWDYAWQLESFLHWCEGIGPKRLRNQPDLIAFNADKRYLGTLAVPTVPTTFVSPGDPLPDLHGEVVVKPNVSAGARDTGRFPPELHADALALVDHIRGSGRTALVQPYLSLIGTRGETAIVYLGGKRSHILRKRPVLREAGIAPLAEGEGAAAAAMYDEDLVVPGSAGEGELRLADAAHDEISERFGTPLYARVDLVPGDDGEPLLIELEALDPNLYLRQAADAPRLLAEAVRPALPSSTR
jgi:hypothetical protein